jgi:hypothetical protein
MVARKASLYLWDSTGTCRSMSVLLSNIALNYTAEAPEVTGFGDDNRTRLPDGLKDYELSFDAFFSTGANEVDEVMSGILGGSTFFAFGPSGSTSGSIMYSASAVCTTYEMSFGVEDAAKVSGTLVNRSGSLTRGTWS